MPIQRLSVQLANQIAAGEVVERPASVVKELMENAIDAKATSITLEIAKSGKNLIKVTDNGSGIPKDELVLALAPHATSKISKLEDLDAIYTLGFRGEALASIASVSKLTLISRTKEQEHAFQVEVSGPEQNPDVQPAAHPMGTSVVVRELFFNTPARRRFLKADKTEFNHIKELFIRLALVNYGVEFKFISDGKVILHVPAIKKADISQRIGKLLGLEFRREGMYFDSFKRGGKANGVNEANGVNKGSTSNISNDTNAESEDIKASVPSFDLDAEQEPIIKLFGVILPPPSLTQSLPDRLLTFLNGRMIADKTVNHAIKEGYMDSILMPHENFKPSVRAVIFMECDPHIVDVNVHPRKDEVRFHNGHLIHETIKQEIVAVLDAYGLNQKNANQAMLDPSLVLDKEKLESKIEPRVTAIEQAQQRLLNWQKQEELSRGSYEYEERIYKNVALQTYIDAYFQRTPQALRPVIQGPCVLKGRLCDFRHIRTPISELDARKSAQREYDAYHQRIYGTAARVTPQAKSFMENMHPVLKSDIKAQAELIERQAREIAEQEIREAMDEFGNLKQAFDLDDLASQSSLEQGSPLQQGTPESFAGNKSANNDPTFSFKEGSSGQTYQAKAGQASYGSSMVQGVQVQDTQDLRQETPQESFSQRSLPQEYLGQGNNTKRNLVFDPRWRQAEQESLKASLQGAVSSSPDLPYSPMRAQGALASVDNSLQLNSFNYQPSQGPEQLGQAEALLCPEREHAPGLFEQLDKTSFIGTGNSNLASTNAGQAMQQRYNQHMLGLHNLQSAQGLSSSSYGSQETTSAFLATSQGQGQGQSLSQGQNLSREPKQSQESHAKVQFTCLETYQARPRHMHWSELVAPAGTGSAFNSARVLSALDLEPQTSGNLPEHSYLGLGKTYPALRLVTPGTDTLGPKTSTKTKVKALNLSLSKALQGQEINAEVEGEFDFDIYLESEPQLIIRTSKEDEKATLLEGGERLNQYAEHSQGCANAKVGDRASVGATAAKVDLPEGTPSKELRDSISLAEGQSAEGVSLEGGLPSYLDHEVQSQFLSLVAHDVILFTLDNRYYVGRGSELYYSFAARNYLRQVQRNEVEYFELPVRFGVKCSSELLHNLRQDLSMQAVRRCGFEVVVNVPRGILEIVKVPMLLTSTDLARGVPRILGLIVQNAAQIVLGTCKVEIAQEIARVRKFEVATASDAKLLLSRIDSFELLQNVRHSSDIKELKLLNLALSMLRNN